MRQGCVRVDGPSNRAVEAAGLEMVISVPFKVTVQRVGLSYPRSLGCMLATRAEDTRETIGKCAMRRTLQGPLKDPDMCLLKHLPPEGTNSPSV